jgi:hypothetical protein
VLGGLCSPWICKRVELWQQDIKTQWKKRRNGTLDFDKQWDKLKSIKLNLYLFFHRIRKRTTHCCIKKRDCYKHNVKQTQHDTIVTPPLTLICIHNITHTICIRNTTHTLNLYLSIPAYCEHTPRMKEHLDSALEYHHLEQVTSGNR